MVRVPQTAELLGIYGKTEYFIKGDFYFLFYIIFYKISKRGNTKVWRAKSRGTHKGVPRLPSENTDFEQNVIGRDLHPS